MTIQSLTSNAVQQNWLKPSEFPNCPNNDSKNPLIDYAAKLKSGSMFCSNSLFSSIIFKTAISDDCKTLYALTNSRSGINPYALAVITYERNGFVHNSRGSFFSQEGAEKYFCLEQGKEWLGGDSIDDYC